MCDIEFPNINIVLEGIINDLNFKNKDSFLKFKNFKNDFLNFKKKKFNYNPSNLQIQNLEKEFQDEIKNQIGNLNKNHKLVRGRGRIKQLKSMSLSEKDSEKKISRIKNKYIARKCRLQKKRKDKIIDEKLKFLIDKNKKMENILNIIFSEIKI